MLKRELLKRNLRLERLEILLWLCFFKVVLIRTMIEVEAGMVIRGVVAEVSKTLVLILVSIMAKHLGIPILDSILVNLLGLPMLLLNFLVFNHILSSRMVEIVLVLIRFKVNLRILDLLVKFVAKMDTQP